MPIVGVDDVGGEAHPLAENDRRELEREEPPMLVAVTRIDSAPPKQRGTMDEKDRRSAAYAEKLDLIVMVAQPQVCVEDGLEVGP